MLGAFITAGCGLFVFLLGAVFWGGATYGRIGKIEGELREMKDILKGLTLLGKLEIEMREVRRRLAVVEGGSSDE